MAEPTDVRVRDLYLVLCKMGYEQGFGHPARMHGLLGHLIRGCKFYTVSVRDGAFEWVRVPGLFFGCLHISEAFGLNYDAVRKCVREAEAENDWEANHAAILAIDDGTVLGSAITQILNDRLCRMGVLSVVIMSWMKLNCASSRRKYQRRMHRGNVILAKIAMKATRRFHWWWQSKMSESM